MSKGIFRNKANVVPAALRYAIQASALTSQRYRIITTLTCPACLTSRPADSFITLDPDEQPHLACPRCAYTEIPV